ncbi:MULTISPECIES: four helix bundle protein [Chryseobacterium]|jgi:four helix bundle protein|uniref:Four helix bundle protein n=1 Tax=Chryseobacterium indoltheticum TaxID=254 RepID=A0A381F7P1_9FLAO|nr:MULTISPECIES: four helix bundle protein [Chryseobacterium]AZA72912.1 four helix bundle protein [Chryseobacterium indoltheticum]MDF2831107.1 ribosomal protein [Chryseobacterium indoltheticum]MDQ8142107.1 four helix bundle protein [Chryseobacterium sp. CFS15]QQQ26689.1 four helix bundle protein [Chryseobacterium indoltheticum]SIP89018.1 four helix bundle protein [Chryseobacterium indoltheticum]
MINDFTEMPVWRKAMDIAEKCFNISETLPRKEDYALTSQLRRSAESISANIAEGFGRRTSKDKSRFYDISRGSAFEAKSHLIYGVRVKYFKETDYLEIKNIIDEVIHEINKIASYLNRQQP